MEPATDPKLEANLVLEEDILQLQTAPSQKQLAITLSTIRHLIEGKASVIVPVEGGVGSDLSVQVLTLENGEQWLSAFTSFDEQLKGSNPVMSTFLSDFGELLDMAYESKVVQGLILNPWNRTLMLDKDLIRIIKGL